MELRHQTKRKDKLIPLFIYSALAAMQRVNIPEFHWTHFWPAVNYAQLGETEAAHKEASEVLRLKPDFALMEEVKIWSFQQDFAAHMAEGARKAGIPVNPGDKPFAAAR